MDKQNSIVTIQFHWLAKRPCKSTDNVDVNDEEEWKAFLDDKRYMSGDPGQEVGQGGRVSIGRASSGRLVCTGDTFEILMSNEEAPKFKRAIDIQWALTQIAAMSGAAEPVDLDGSEDESDGGFGELAIAPKVAESLDEVERPMVRMPLRPLPPQIAAMSGAAEPMDLDGSEDESDRAFGELAIALKVAQSLDEVERPMVRMPLRSLPPQSLRTPTRGRSPTTYNPPGTIGGNSPMKQPLQMAPLTTTRPVVAMGENIPPTHAFGGSKGR
jgi:hypothetical protein